MLADSHAISNNIHASETHILAFEQHRSRKLVGLPIEVSNHTFYGLLIGGNCDNILFQWRNSDA